MDCTFTKIIATLGPETSSKEKIKDLIYAGVSLFRLNYSHGTKKTHLQNMTFIRQIEKEIKRPIGVICDMQGPKLRIGQFKEGQITLKKGAHFKLDMESKLGSVNRVCLPHQEIFDVLKKGAILLLNDGNIILEVKKVGAHYADTIVVNGGPLSDHKGVNVPNVTLPLNALTSKDLSDLENALKIGADWIALSFVQRPEDILKAKEKIKDRAWIIAKIEKPAALNHLEEIIQSSDAIMVARGDLGVECPLENLPKLQKHIVSLCRKQGKPVVIATQMLESMIQNPTPTRAEVSDVATAVYDGADCVMLSGETAIGTYPINAATIMHKIIAKTEEDPFYKKQMEILTIPPDHLIASAITSSIPNVAHVLEKPACVVTYSVSGSTTLRVARERTNIPILNLTCSEQVMRRCTLVWGVTSALTKNVKKIDDIFPAAIHYSQKFGFAKAGEQLIITAGIPFATKGNTNLIHILTINKNKKKR